MDEETLSYVVEDEMFHVEQGIWKDRWGNETPVTKMTADHIQNCLRLLRKREDGISWAWVKRFEGELERRSA